MPPGLHLLFALFNVPPVSRSIVIIAFYAHFYIARSPQKFSGDGQSAGYLFFSRDLAQTIGESLSPFGSSRVNSQA
jgi:hypothetical protein